jgi:molybdopterin-biosynthesis enzyme MoeA-like protein
VDRIVTIPDDIDTIAEEVRQMSAAYDYVFTSGGIGPTHDDLTIDGIAKAFGRPIELSDSIAARIERAQGKKPNESQLKMARIPAGAQLVDAADFWFPVVIVENVHIFPGIPELLRKKFESIRERFRGVPVLLRRVFVKRMESDIAASLHELLSEFPELMLGSYPRMGEKTFHVLLTLESRDAGYLEQALSALLERLPRDAIHKVE